MQTARWMGVPPWELAKAPLGWYEQMRFVMEVENGLGKMEIKKK